MRPKMGVGVRAECGVAAELSNYESRVKYINAPVPTHGTHTMGRPTLHTHRSEEAPTFFVYLLERGTLRLYTNTQTHTAHTNRVRPSGKWY